MRAIVFSARPSDLDRAGRSARALRMAGLSVLDLSEAPWTELLGRIQAEGRPVWLLRAGAWPAGLFTPPSASATGKPLIAVGGLEPGSDIVADAVPEAIDWQRLLHQSGGVFRPETLPSPLSVWIDERVVEAMSDAGNLDASLRSASAASGARIVHYGGLDVHDDPALRIAEVVTSAQRGGAERIALDLSVGLKAHGFRSRLVILGRPTRAPFEVPADTIDASGLLGPGSDHRARRAARRLVAEGIDLVHGHLLDRDTVAAFRARSLPVALTLHNTATAWPSGTRKLETGEASLLIGCAQVVEAQLRESGLALPVRTVWNGVDFSQFNPDPERLERARAWREGVGLSPADFVLLALANPRPQKRLHLLPGILRATRDLFASRGIARAPKLVIAGSASAGNPAARRALLQIERAIDESGVRDDVRMIGNVVDTAACLLGSDVLISTSAHEGLSLAQVEALASGRPIVVTDVGGARELAALNESARLVDVDAPAASFAGILAGLVQDPRRLQEGRERARRDFDLGRMLEGYARLLPRALRSARRGPDSGGLFLVANNFSTGGAQTSARRLLLGLRERGVKVNAAVIQEQEAFPTPGRAALLAAGVEVLVVPRVGTIDASRAVSLLTDAIDRERPRAVVFWNLIPEYKILLADGLIDVRVFDVSPGEMYFESLDRYFANPRPGLPYRTALDYGRRLDGVVVKYAAERDLAGRTSGAPVHVIPNGVPFVDERPMPRLASAPLVIGTTARLDPRKHVDRLLRALGRVHAKMPPYVLRIAGGPEPGFPEYEGRLRGLAQDMSVEFVGEVADAAAFLKGLDLFALVAEPAGCPNASLEAMARGLAVIATDAGGMSEQVEDGVTGRLVGRDDEEAFGEALLQVASDPERRLAMGSAGRTRVRERFSMAAMVDHYAALCLAG